MTAGLPGSLCKEPAGILFWASSFTGGPFFKSKWSFPSQTNLLSELLIVSSALEGMPKSALKYNTDLEQVTQETSAT